MPDSCIGHINYLERIFITKNVSRHYTRFVKFLREIYAKGRLRLFRRPGCSAAVFHFNLHIVQNTFNVVFQYIFHQARRLLVQHLLQLISE